MKDEGSVVVDCDIQESTKLACTTLLDPLMDRDSANIAAIALLLLRPDTGLFGFRSCSMMVPPLTNVLFGSLPLFSDPVVSAFNVESSTTLEVVDSVFLWRDLFLEESDGPIGFFFQFGRCDYSG